MLRPVTAESVSVASPALLDSELRTAALTALRERARRCTCPCRSTCSAPRSAGSWTPLPVAAYRPNFVDLEALAAALAVFEAAGTAANVVLLAGPGVAARAREGALIASAERFQIPVATTLGAKGLVPEDHPLSLGVFGYGGSRWAIEAMLDPAVEVLIVVGSALSQRDTMNWDPKMLPSAELVHVDADPSLIGRTWPASVPVTASPRAALERLAAVDGGVADGLAAGCRRRRAFLPACAVAAADLRGGGHATATRSRCTRRDGVGRARAAAPGHVLCVDSGAHRAWCAEYWLSPRRPRLPVAREPRPDGRGDRARHRGQARAARAAGRRRDRRRLHAHART